MIAMCQTRGYGTLWRLGGPYTKRRENVCMCVYGMLHGTLAVLSRYLNVAFHRHYDYTYTQRERGREGDVRI